MQAGDVELDVCPRCRGVWFDAGELEQFPDRPSVRVFMSSARQAASRCRKTGHLVPRALAVCATCRSAPVSCPACGSRLSLVAAGPCAIDVCTQCEGVWLDAGEMELLRGVKGPAPKPAPRAKATGWVVPESTGTGPDPWRGPGSDRPLTPSAPPEVRLNSRSPMDCHHCGERTVLSEAWAKDGDIYCGRCRPPGATSGARLPRDIDSSIPEFGSLGSTRGRSLISWILALFD